VAVESIRVRTRCLERAWHGGCERSEPTCSQAQVNAIIASLNRIYDKVDGCDLSGLSDLKRCLKRAHLDVVWKCGGLPSGIAGRTSGNEISISTSVLSGTQSRRDAVIFHEMVHACGGTELDAEAFENHCYSGAGATTPTSDDFPKFRDDGGRFVNWNPSTGAVTTKDGNQSMNVSGFQDPDPDDGGW
jgi:hypothetical protein